MVEEGGEGMGFEGGNPYKHVMSNSKDSHSGLMVLKITGQLELYYDIDVIDQWNETRQHK